MPVAVKLVVDPVLTVAVAGVMAILFSVMTVRAASGEVLPPYEAVIVVVPAATPVATPAGIVATPVSDDVQVTVLVMLAVLASE